MTNNPHYIQEIDLMKGLLIVSVIFGHTFSYVNNSQNNTLSNSYINSMHTNITTTSIIIQNLDIVKILTHWITYSSLSTQQVVPIFISIIAFNFALSYRRKEYAKISDIYSKREFSSRFKRFFVPFITIYIAFLIFGITYYLSSKINLLSLNYFLLIGYLPINGPGNYFISIIFQFLLIFPIIYLIYRKYSKITLISSFIIALLFEFIASSIPFPVSNSTIYSILIIRFLPLIALSLWISDNYQLFAKRNYFIVILSALSIGYLIIISQFQYTTNIFGINFIPYYASQNMFASFYQILLVLIGLKYLPKSKMIIFKLLSLIGKSSYHIFLIQIVYFGLMYSGFIQLSSRYNSISDLFLASNISIIIINLSICIITGCAFYIADNKNKYSNLALQILHDTDLR
jgi:peptidoglycan/LPS O-acetylase OafA/YrhL